MELRCGYRTVATYQTLLRPARLEKFDPAQLKAIIVDEAHHAAAPSYVSRVRSSRESLMLFTRYRRILSRFDSAIRSPVDTEGTEELPTPSHRIPILGFSATFSRHDGLALGSVFERIVYHRDFLEMIKEQWYVHPFSCTNKPFDTRDIGCVTFALPQFGPT